MAETLRDQSVRRHRLSLLSDVDLVIALQGLDFRNLLIARRRL